MFKNSKLFFMFEGADDDIQVIDPFDAEGLKKALDTTSAQKKIWRDKAVDPTTGKTYKELYDEKIAELAKPATPAPAAPGAADGKGNNNPASVAPDADWLFDNIDVISTLAPDERTALRKEAKELGVDPVKFIKSGAGQAQLKEIRAAQKSNGAAPPPSNHVPTFKGKPVKDILTDDKASPADKQSAYEARMRGTKVNQSE